LAKLTFFVIRYFFCPGVFTALSESYQITIREITTLKRLHIHIKWYSTLKVQ